MANESIREMLNDTPGIPSDAKVDNAALPLGRCPPPSSPYIKISKVYPACFFMWIKCWSMCYTTHLYSKNRLHAVWDHQGMCFPSCLPYLLYFGSSLVGSTLNVHVFSFCSRGGGVHQIIHKNKSMANSILHSECPL